MSKAELFLVSGGSGGIGSVLCDRLAEKGFIPVVAFSRGEEAARQVAKRTSGMALALDLTSATSLTQAVTWLAGQEATLAGVVLAGAPALQLNPFGKITPEELDVQWQINVKGPQQLLAELVRQCFRKNKRGTVVGVLTKAMGENAQGAASGMGAYIMGKYGLLGVLAALAADYSWLRVRSVKPGYTETRMLNAFDERFLALARERETFHSPEQVASLILEEIVKP